MKESFSALVCIEPMANPLNKSGTPTSPMDGVTLIVIKEQIFLVFELDILRAGNILHLFCEPDSIPN
jgi:hypothetical protein